MRGGHYIRILCVGWPLHKDSLCGVAIAYNSLYGEEAIYIYIYACIPAISYEGVAIV